MLKHIIAWKLRSDLSDAEKKEAAQRIKEGLEGLRGKIPGMLEIHVHIQPLSTSNTDLLLDSVFEDEAALKVYAEHPLHVYVKENITQPAVESRACFDYTE